MCQPYCATSDKSFLSWSSSATGIWKSASMVGDLLGRLMSLATQMTLGRHPSANHTNRCPCPCSNAPPKSKAIPKDTWGRNHAHNTRCQCLIADAPPRSSKGIFHPAHRNPRGEVRSEVEQANRELLQRLAGHRQGQAALQPTLILLMHQGTYGLMAMRSPSACLRPKGKRK